MGSKVVEAFTFDESSKLKVLDQTLLPLKVEYVDVPDTEAGYLVIKSMKVRGAPCIAAVGCLSLVAELNLKKNQHVTKSSSELLEIIREMSEFLIESRPTAVNLRKALRTLIGLGGDFGATTRSSAELVKYLTDICRRAIRGGLDLNQNLGRYGAEAILDSNPSHSKFKILTHCNTGGLATVGYGTALGVIRSLNDQGKLERAFCTETRPYNQGSRLTAWELVTEDIPATLISDSMVAALMATQSIHAVVVGADCVAANGDTANKIGTMQIALIAKHYNVPFYIAAPTQSIDLTVKSKDDIKIEQRPASELRSIGNIQLAPNDIDVWNPCFDVTPANLITSIITECGICAPDRVPEFLSNVTSPETTNVPLIF